MRRLTTEQVAVVVFFGLLFIIGTRQPTDTDTWWHLRAGQYTLDHGIIRADPFSFTKAGVPWIDHSWGGQLVLYGVWKLAGSYGLSLYTSVLALAGMWFVHRSSTGSGYARGLALLLGGMAAAIFWTPRPQMLSFLLTSVLLYLLHLHKRGGAGGVRAGVVWWIPLLMAVWGNLHAGYAIGFILLLGSVGGEILGHLFDPDGEAVLPWSGVRRLALVTGASVVAVMANPYGWKILTVPFDTVSIGALQDYIAEWRSPDFHTYATWPFAFLLLALIGVLGASRRRLDWADFCLAAGTAFMALMATRNIATFALVATPIVARHLVTVFEDRGWVAATEERVAPLQTILYSTIILLVVAAGATKLVLEMRGPAAETALRRSLPVGAVDYLEATDPPGPMFNSYNWGGYLMWRLPDRLVFVDGRTDLYGDTFLVDDYLHTVDGAPGWQDTLDRYDIAVVVIEPDSALARNLQGTDGWRLAYQDDKAAVLERTS